MNILFFLEPSIEHNNPYFRYATLRNSICPQAEILKEKHEVVLFTSEQIANKAIVDGHAKKFNRVLGINSMDWGEGEGSCSTLIRYQKNEITEAEIEIIKEKLKNILGSDYTPDLVISWESPTYYLEKIFPTAKFIYQSPGFFSRAPYPSLVLFDNSLLNSEPVENLVVLDKEIQSFQDARTEYVSLLREVCPLTPEINHVYRKFNKVVLLPLQIDNYFMIDALLADGVQQFDILVKILKSTPPNIGVWVTNYRSKDIQSAVLSDANIAYLKSHFDNFIYFDKCNEIPSVSQFLVPLLDGVLTISSSVGYQAAYYNKQLCLLGGKNQLSPFTSAESLSDFYMKIINNELNDKDQLIINTIKHKHLSSNFISSKKYLNWVDEFIETGKYPSWAEDVNYSLNLLKRESVLLSELGRLNGQNYKFNYGACDELSIEIKKYDVISFDIFDTLLYRPFKRPSDLFKFMESSVHRLLNDNTINFYDVRRKSEAKAFQIAIENGIGEITLEEIYEQLALELDISIDEAQNIAKLEMQFEMDLLYPRNSGKAAFDEAIALGKTVIIISDMYLSSDFLSQVLSKNGYDGYQKLFVSSSYKAKKHNGKLFDAVLKEVVYPASSILHIGDNEIGDIKQSKQRGMASFHLTKAMDLFEHNSAYVRPWLRDENNHSTDWKMILSIFGQKLHDNPKKIYRKGTVFNGDRWVLGYMGFGALLLGYTKWLIEKSIKDNIQTLYFLARDGKIMKEAYDIVAKLYPDAPKSVYMFCSRRSVNLAKVESFQDIVDLLYVDFAHRVSLGSLLENRFGLSYENIDLETLKEFGLSWGSKLTKDDLPRLTLLMKSLESLILSVALEERENYIAYLGQIGFLGQNEKTAIVDIGYAGTMQESLYQLSGKNISGYYLITFRKALDRLEKNGLASKAYLAEFIDRHDTYHPFCRHVPLYETLFSTTDTSFIKMSKTWDNQLNPVFMPQVSSENDRIIFVKSVHKGALEFIKDATVILDNYFKNIDLEPNKTLRLLDQLFNDPHLRDVKMFSGIVFEDAYGGTQRKVILPLDNEMEQGGVWKRGIDVLRKNLEPKKQPKVEHVRNKAQQRVAVKGIEELKEDSYEAIHSLHNNRKYAQRVFYKIVMLSLSERKKQKFLKNPQLFFYDSKSNGMKALGKWYLKA